MTGQYESFEGLCFVDTLDIAEGAQMRVAAGSPGERLSATGIPPGTYLLVVLLEDVPDPGAAQTAATEVASLVFGWS